MGDNRLMDIANKKANELGLELVHCNFDFEFEFYIKSPILYKGKDGTLFFPEDSRFEKYTDAYATGHLKLFKKL